MENDLMSMLSSVMSNPESAEKLKNIAGNFLQGDNTQNDEEFSVPTSQDNSMNFMSGMANNKNINLLNAIAPYMSKNRAAKLGSAIKAIRMINVLNSMKW